MLMTLTMALIHVCVLIYMIDIDGLQRMEIDYDTLVGLLLMHQDICDSAFLEGNGSNGGLMEDMAHCVFLSMD